MPEPQPGADRPAEGSPRGTEPVREPAVAGESTSSPVPPETADEPAAAAEPEGTRGLSDREPDPADGPDGTRRLSDSEPDPADGPDGTRRLSDPEPDPADGPDGTRRLADPKPAGGAPGSPRPDEPSPAVTDEAGGPDGPSGTRRLPAVEAADAAPRWSGSAPVPPPPPRRRAWGESADPTPVPAAPPELPEHQIPVDPWAGADTGGWELPSAELPALPPPPPTLPYPAPPPTRPYSGPPAPAPLPHPMAPPAHPVPPPAHPVSPPAVRPPVVAAPPAAPPPAPPKQRRSKRRGAPPPAAPPPGWQAPKGYVPVPVRRRRRWPWLLLLTLACCCGCPAYYGRPIWTQYPAHATLPAQVDDLSLREDSTSEQAARQLETEVREAHWLAEDTFAGVYATPDGKRVTVFGGTGFRLDPEGDADGEIARLAGSYRLGQVETVDTGVRGRHERCAVGHTDEGDVVVCTSVDHGSIATAVFTRLSVQDSAALLARLRTRIVTNDQS